MSVFIYFLLQKTLSLLVSRGLLTRLTLREVLKSIFLPVLVFLPSCLSLNLYRLSQTSGWWSDPGSSSVSDWHHYSSKWVHFSAVHSRLLYKQNFAKPKILLVSYYLKIVPPSHNKRLHFTGHQIYWTLMSWQFNIPHLILITHI